MREREEQRRQPPPLSRAAALALNRNPSGNRTAGPGWRHACHVLLYAALPAGAPPPGYAVLMQLRFDGLFGFPGGLVEPGEESLEAGLQRELREELGPAAGRVELSPRHHRGAKAWPPNGSGSDVGLVTHFYIRRLRWEELVAVERGGPRAAEHGLEVQGLVRVPLGGGLPAFLRHRFAGDARQQLLGALPALGIPPPPPQNPRGDPSPQNPRGDPSPPKTRGGTPPPQTRGGTPSPNAAKRGGGGK